MSQRGPTHPPGAVRGREAPPRFTLSVRYPPVPVAMISNSAKQHKSVEKAKVPPDSILNRLALSCLSTHRVARLVSSAEFRHELALPAPGGRERNGPRPQVGRQSVRSTRPRLVSSGRFLTGTKSFERADLPRSPHDPERRMAAWREGENDLAGLAACSYTSPPNPDAGGL